jgi:stage IV sporulation protein FA
MEPNTKHLLEENIYNKNISFARINQVYEKLFGKIYPIEKIEKNTSVNIEPVFSEKLSYLNKEDYKEGVKLTVTDNYLVPILESGIVVYMGDKDNYGYTIIIEQVNGIDLWYVGVKNCSLKLYEYVEKGNMLGEVEKELYLFGQKDGKFVSPKEYLG